MNNAPTTTAAALALMVLLSGCTINIGGTGTTAQPAYPAPQSPPAYEGGQASPPQPATMPPQPAGIAEGGEEGGETLEEEGGDTIPVPQLTGTEKPSRPPIAGMR